MTKTSSHHSEALVDLLPGHHLLELKGNDAMVEGVREFNELQRLSALAASHMLLQRQSMSVAYPNSNNLGIAQWVMFLHAFRMGLITESGLQTPWFNALTMTQRTDLVLLTTPMSYFQQLKHMRAVTCIHVNKRFFQKATKDCKKGGRRTLLVNPDNDLLDCLDNLEQTTKPFAFLLDCGIGGKRRELSTYYESLESFFPDIPKVVVYENGDSSVFSQVTRPPFNWHHWKQTPQLGHNDSGNSMPEITIKVIEDPFLTSTLLPITKKVNELSDRLRKAYPELYDQLIPPIKKVIYTLFSMPCNYKVLDQVIYSQRRRGLFPVRTLSVWLNKIDAIDIKSGELYQIKQDVVKSLSECLEQLKDQSTLTAKAQTALSMFASGDVFLVNDRFEAEALELHRLTETDEATHRSKVYSLRDKRHLNLIGENIDSIVVSAKLWSDRQWILARGKKITFLAYNFEVKPLRHSIEHWFRENNLNVNAAVENKWWQLDFRPDEHINTTGSPIGGLPTISLEASKYHGAYTAPAFDADIVYQDQHSDWVNALYGNSDNFKIDLIDEQVPIEYKDQYLIGVEEQNRTLAFSEHQKLLCITNNSLDPLQQKKVSDIVVGDCFIALSDGQDKSCTLNRLFEYFVEEFTGLANYQMIADTWDQIILDALGASDNNRTLLHQTLKEGGVKIVRATLNTWISGKHAPERGNIDAIRILAEKAGDKDGEKISKLVMTALELLRSERRKLGGDLRKAILERKRGASLVKIGSCMLDVDDLDALLAELTVTSIKGPSN